MIKKGQIKFIIITVFTLLFSISSFSQNFKEEKRIYLLDITGSMWAAGGGQNIFTEVKNSLINTINALDNPETSITVITFGKGIEDVWKSKASAEGKKEIISRINSYDDYEGKDVQKATNICDALEEANNEIDTNLFNYLFLYTDGDHNYPNSSLQCVRGIVNEICKKNNRTDDVYPFYIMLTDNASSTELKDALSCFTIYDNNCQTPEIVIVRPEKNKTSINLLENKLSTEINFIANKKTVLPSKVKIKVNMSNDPNFRLKNNIFTLDENLGFIKLEFEAKQNLNDIKARLPLMSKLNLSFTVDYISKVGNCKTIEMRPENIIVDVINKREKTVIISIVNEDK